MEKRRIKDDITGNVATFRKTSYFHVAVQELINMTYGGNMNCTDCSFCVGCWDCVDCLDCLGCRYCYLCDGESFEDNLIGEREL